VIPVLLAATLLAGDVDAPGLHRAVRAQRGRVVVVNFWATWCEPCVKEFPDFVALARERKDVAVISVTIDDRADRPAVEEFLKKQKAPFPVYIKADGNDEAFINGIDTKWSGAVPLTIVYDASGQRTYFDEREITRAELEKLLPTAPRSAPAPSRVR